MSGHDDTCLGVVKVYHARGVLLGVDDPDETVGACAPTIDAHEHEVVAVPVTG
jgi:hypothetical protein